MSRFTFFALAAATFLTSANGQACTQSGGNWYCNQVRGVSYSNFATSGTYDTVSYMNDNTGECKFEKYSYSGVVAPFNEELSVHIRGPFSLKQFAFYTPTASLTAAAKIRRDRKQLARRLIEERGAGALSCPTSNGTTFSTGGKKFQIECGMDRQGLLSTSNQPNFAACIASCASTTGCVQVTFIKSSNGACYLKGTSASLRPQDYVRGRAGARLLTTNPSAYAQKVVAASPIGWTRQSYYSATDKISSGVTFLNNMGGGSMPGIWSSKFGNSLGFASSDGLSPAASTQTLSDVTLPSNTELSIWTASPCTAGQPCPYSRPGSVAYHGFGGQRKVFLFEFSMPSDGATTGANPDMPALWLLNARIPRTQQYGACSCWANTRGCGELDVFEVLTKGEKRMISSVHADRAATNPNYFARPTGATIKAVLIMDGAKVHIRLLDDTVEFGAGLAQSLVSSWVDVTEKGLVADMALPSL